MALFDYSPLNNALNKAKNISLFCHVNPDGDCIGSAFALKLFLEKSNHQVKIISPNPTPEFYNWIPGIETILIHEQEQEKCETIISNSDVLISVDHNSPSRIPDFEKLFRKSSALKFMFDHHNQPEENAYDCVFSLPGTSSTAEIVYDYLMYTNPENIDKNIALGIYVGILTDTGSFSYSANSPATYRIIAELIEKGIVPKNIHQNIYASMPENRLRLLGYCISEKLVVLKNLNTAYIWLSKKDLEKFNYQNGDAEGVVNYALSIQGIKFAALFKESENKIRISFRSKDDFPANDFARKHFLGGGHLNAAGGDSFDTLENTLKRFENTLTEYKDALLKNANIS